VQSVECSNVGKQGAARLTIITQPNQGQNLVTLGPFLRKIVILFPTCKYSSKFQYLVDFCKSSSKSLTQILASQPLSSK
jgi:hypothetical protein